MVRWEGGGCRRAAGCRPYIDTPLRCHAPTPTKRRYPERDVEGAVPYGGIGQLSSVFNHPEGIHSCAMAQFMVKPIHAPRQFMPARAIHWPSAAMPPPAGCYLKYWEMPGFQQDNPPVSFADSLLCTRRPWDGANPEDIGRCGARGEHGKQPLSRGKGAV